jgi:hypothetical protein
VCVFFLLLFIKSFFSTYILLQSILASSFMNFLIIEKILSLIRFCGSSHQDTGKWTNEDEYYIDLCNEIKIAQCVFNYSFDLKLINDKNT